MVISSLIALASTPHVSPWYENAWLIGIATGLASGALLTAITPAFLRTKRARDLAIKQDRAAEDVLAALRPTVATGTLPTAETVQAIWRAAAYKRQLDPKLATPVLNLIDVLVSEVMVSAFLNSEVRMRLASDLLKLERDLGLDHRMSTVISASRDSSLSTTITFSIVGACTLGAVSAVSAVTKSWIPVLILGVLGFFALCFFVAAISLFGERIMNVRIGSGAIEFFPPRARKVTRRDRIPRKVHRPATPTPLHDESTNGGAK